ncbi:hypothetical protein [Rhodoferax sp.]|uniref:hypothetical protein n=1 Tax=Rhodoferax sp. TaxID=50421 RepID=UPI002ACE722E|nr:hypothetical protein [Rhodoferax sp.]MDZ7919534.1 hypothetical protein [Rhodoferax sp.]
MLGINCPGLKIVAPGDATVQRLEATAAEFGISRTYTSAQDLFMNEARTLWTSPPRWSFIVRVELVRAGHV